jgi:uncharacterized protein YbaR (Trm112 family)
MIALCTGALPAGHLALDYCPACRGIWFDPYESTRLEPASILELFRIIRDAEKTGTQPMASRLFCPRCPESLLATRDIVRSGPIAYYRCPNAHGRFTPFSQFLTEKGFVRHISKTEIRKIAVSVGQINCHACGGPIDLRVDLACPHCRSPIAVLDAEAIAKAFQGYGEAAAPRIREMTGDLSVSVRRFPYLPQPRGTSLLELGIGAVVQLFD